MGAQRAALVLAGYILCCGRANGGQTRYCAPDLDPPSSLAASLESETAWLEAQQDASHLGPSAKPDARSYQESCEDYIHDHFSVATACVSDDDCGGTEVGICDAGLCQCRPGRSGSGCNIDAVAVCLTEDYWTAFGSHSGAPCAGTASRAACSPDKGSIDCPGDAWCAVTDQLCVCGPGECWDAVTRRCKVNDEHVSARAWASRPRGELDDSRLMSRTDNFGIALSGGGTRAMVSAIGVLRGLRHLGLLDRARYLGANSGGSWAGAIYTYADESIDDDELLGFYVPPEELSNASVLTLSPKSAAAAARNPFGAMLLTMANDAPIRYRDMWSLSVSKAFFEPYGFGKLMSYFAYDSSSVSDIKKRNPALKDARFDTVRKDRPYLLMSATMLGPRAQAVGNGGIGWSDQSYQNFVFSPLWVAPVTSIDPPPGDGGGPGYKNVSFYCDSKSYGCAAASTFVYPAEESSSRRGRRGKNGGGGGGGPKDHAIIAVGGAVEPFAFGAGSAARGLTGDDGAVAQEDVLAMGLPDTPFSLAFASGISSSAAAAALSAQPMGLPGKYCRLAHLAPVIDYMSPVPAEPAATPMAFGDGMSLDNFGIMGMLARGVDKVLLVVSTATPLDLKLTPSKPKDGEVDGSLLALFGVGSTKKNFEMVLGTESQVFEQAGLEAILTGLVATRRQGTAVAATGEATIKATTRNGLQARAGNKVSLHVMYLDRIIEWEAKVKVSEASFVVPAIKRGNRRRCGDDCGPLKRFPHYSTIAQNDETDPLQTFAITDDYKLLSERWTNLTDLTTVQVTTLMHLQAYAVVSQADKLSSFLGLEGGGQGWWNRWFGSGRGEEGRGPEGKDVGGGRARQQSRGGRRRQALPVVDVGDSPMLGCCAQCAVDAKCGVDGHIARHVTHGQWDCFASIAEEVQPGACIDDEGGFRDCPAGAGTPVKSFELSHHALHTALRASECGRGASLRSMGGGAAWIGAGASSKAWFGLACVIALVIAAPALPRLRALGASRLREGVDRSASHARMGADDLLRALRDRLRMGTESML